MKISKSLIAAAAMIVLLGSTTAQAAGSLNIYNWSGYIAPDLVEKFQNETGIDITLDFYNSNETLLAKLKQGGGGYDIAIATNDFVQIMISEGLIQQIDATKLPGYENTIASLKSPDTDPGNKYSYPYMWGTTSFAVNTNKFGGDVDTYKTLFEPPKELSGNINMFDSADAVVNMASIYLDIPFCSEDGKEMQRVLNLLKAQKAHVKTYSSNFGAIRESLVAEELDMSTFWSGSTMRTRSMNPAIRYAFPKEGVLAWVDSVVVPKSAKNLANAKRFISFLMQPENAALNSNFLKYQNSVMGSDKYFAPELADAPEMAVPEGRKVYFAKTCGEKATKLRDRVWTNLLK
jgi:spermidine/putrescine transport system substrate-binding protein|tara:strand:- start:406 stop:1446 length:1041 start_codon:yes stop_codon:yes gene_type:complete